MPSSVVKQENFVGRITANVSTPTVMYRLPPGDTRVDVTYPDGTTATVTPKQTQDPENTTNLAPVEVNGTEVELTNTGSFVLTGPCWVCFIVASFSGSDPISVFGTR